jgi:hypothetical protein
MVVDGCLSAVGKSGVFLSILFLAMRLELR